MNIIFPKKLGKDFKYCKKCEIKTSENRRERSEEMDGPLFWTSPTQEPLRANYCVPSHLPIFLEAICEFQCSSREISQKYGQFPKSKRIWVLPLQFIVLVTMFGSGVDVPFDVWYPCVNAKGTVERFKFNTLTARMMILNFKTMPRVMKHNRHNCTD